MAEPPKGTPDIIENPGEFTTDGLFFLRAAQAAIRRECGWHVTPSWPPTTSVTAGAKRNRTTGKHYP